MRMKISEIEKKYRDNSKGYQSAIVAWQNVKRATKKDGSDFANFGKNFVNATVRQEYSWCKPELKIDYDHNGYWSHDSITIEDNDTVDDMFKKINNRVNMFRSYVEEDEKKANNAQYVFTEVNKTMVELVKFCKQNGFSSYEVGNYIQSNCWDFE